MARKKAKEMPKPKEDGHKWAKMDRDLVKGDVLRIRVKNDELPEYGQYAYGICTGEGFGCDPNLRGTAIYMDWVGYDPEEVIGHRHEEPPAVLHERSERWERNWHIQYLVE